MINLRYVRMIEMVRPNTTDFNNSIFIGDKGIDEDNAKKEMDKTIDDERSKLGLSVSNKLKLFFLRNLQGIK